MVTRFWEEKPLSDMSNEEWEQLCDGCGRCCMIKLEDEDTGDIFYTNVVCSLLDLETCTCTDYANRLTKVTGCLKVEVNDSTRVTEFPSTCAYRLLVLGKKLHPWHPLLSGDVNSVHMAGISVRDKVVSEEFIHQDQLEEHVITWEPMIPAD